LVSFTRLTMNLLKTFCILTTFCIVIQSQATIILVENVNDAGIGSLRQAVADVSSSANDTILIDIKGTIVLDSPIEFDSFTALTVIGPYAKHNTITAGGAWSGSLFHISNSEGITFRSLGFESGNGNTRHVSIENCPNDILFERCIFEDNDYAIGDGGAVNIISSTASFSQCSFIDNQATNGGAIATNSNTALTLTNCTFSENFATGNAGALCLEGNTTAILLFNTFVNNDASGTIKAIRTTGTTSVNLGNNAIGDNGTGRQIRLNGLVVSLGRNIIKQNFGGEPINLPSPVTGDLESTGVTLGLRTAILEDGYGLKYWPITDSGSDLINPASPGAAVPDFDCRNAPRNLKGTSGSNAYPDAGACEYTHLRVTSDAGNVSANSFLQILGRTQKDAMHYIEFDIPSASDILLNDEGIIDGAPYIIDGYSQHGSAIPGPHEVGTPGVTRPNLPIDIVNDGGNNHGIKFDDDTEGSILQGVSVQGFDRHGVEPNNSDNISILGCEIGINDAGTENGNGFAGIRINSSNNIIGGWEHWMRNTISGNGLAGSEQSNIYISIGNNSNIIKGNIIGGSPDGMSGIGGPPTLGGIYVASRFNIIGGTLPNAGNIIIDNQWGTFHFRTGDFNTYQGNLIGLAYDESTAVGNSITGIEFEGCDDNLVGGYTAEAANIIAHNVRGIIIGFGTTIAERNAILGNSIYANDFQGIDINDDDAVLVNDGLFNGTNSNQGIDFPEITESTACGGSSTITTFDLRVPTSEDYRVEFFTVTSPDVTNGEGEIFIGFTTVSVTTNPQTIVYDHGYDVGAGLWLTATVTQISSGNTSEFGANVLTAAPSGDPSISYDDICPWEIATPNFDGDIGGDFRFSDPVPVDGATIDPASGEITGALEGTTYEVIYGFTGICSVEDTALFSVLIIDETFTMDDFCPESDGTATGIITPGGAFSLNPDFGDGASITADGGILTGGIEGTTYTVQYIANDGLCIDTGSVDVFVTSVDESFTMADICPEVTSADAVPIEAGGDFYFAPDPGDGATINMSTGAITGGVEDAIYIVGYAVGTCGEADTISVSVIGIDESFTFPDFCPGTIGMPDDVIETGGFSFLTPPGDGAIINPGTGFITGGTEETIYEVLHTVGACNDKDTLYPMMIEVLEDFTFADFCEVNDSSAIVPLADDPANSYFMLLGPDDGATINATTGRIYDPMEGTTYTVVDSVWSTGCWQADTVEVLTILVNEHFEYNSICLGATGFPNDDVELGGVFSIVDDTGDGIIIDAGTGALSGGLIGTTYTIRYIKDTGLCSDTLEQEVIFIEVDASFEFLDFCPGLDLSPEPTEIVEGGVYDFEFDPGDGATINFVTGAISNPIEDNSYSVIYTLYDIDIPTCFDKDTQVVSVILVEEEVDYDDFCWYDDSFSAIVLDLGTLTFGYPTPTDGAYLSVDGLGVIIDATEGSVYNIVHTAENEGCIQVDSTLVTAIGVDESFIFDDYCAAETSPTPVPTVEGGEWDFFEIPDIGTTIDLETGVITHGLEDSMYVIMYTAFSETGDCSETAIDTVYVLGNDESFTIDNFCAEFASDSPIPAVDGGTYTFEPDPEPGDDAVIDPLTGIITLADPGATYGVMYTLVTGSCTESDTNLVIAYESEVATFTIEDYCANIPTPIEVTGTPGGAFNFDPSPAPDGATIDASTGTIDGSLGGTYDITYITSGTATTCADTITKAVTLYDIPSILEILSEEDIYCPDDILGPITITDNFAASQIYWYIGDTGGDISDSSFTYTPESLNVGDNTFYAKPKSSEGCYGEYASYILYLSDTSGMNAISDFEICLGSPAQLLAYGGSTYIWHTDVPLADNTVPGPIAFSLQEEVYVVSIFNNDGCEVVDTISVKFKSQNECAIDINNAFSPNGDDKNEFWYIDNLINYMPNTVYIYNRWGDEVRKIDNYDNITQYWDGTGKYGKKLPPNTYFYVVITEGTDQSQAGWVQLVR
jgi:gliding motility-associated-like protein